MNKNHFLYDNVKSFNQKVKDIESKTVKKDNISMTINRTGDIEITINKTEYLNYDINTVIFQELTKMELEFQNFSNSKQSKYRVKSDSLTPLDIWHIEKKIGEIL